MNLKIYLFDKSTVKSDFKRFWWVPVIYMLILAMIVLPKAVFVDNVNMKNIGVYCNSDEGVFAFIFSFFMAGMVFSYVHKGSAVSMIHGLPISRRTQYLSHILSSVVLLIIPVIIASTVIGIEGISQRAVYSDAAAIAFKYALKYFYTCCIYILLGFFITAFTVMISGNTIAAYLFSIAAVIFPSFVYYITNYILTNNLYGFSGIDPKIMDYIYISDVKSMWSYDSIWYVILIVILFFGCMKLYEIRKLENYDEIVAFNILKPVFMFGASLCFGLFGGYIIYQASNINSIFLGSIPLGITALIAANMINKKSFTVKGILKPAMLYIAVIAAFKLTLAYDLTGYERRVPHIENIESIEPYENIIGRTYFQYYCSDVKAPEYGTARGIAIKITDENEIKNISDFHRFISDNKAEMKNNTKNTGIENPVWIDLKYNLKNGKTLKRSYTLDGDLCGTYLKAYYETPEYKLAKYPIISDSSKTIKNVTYCGDTKTGGDIQLRYIDYNKLTEALKKDIDGLDYEIIYNMNKELECGEYISINYTETLNYKGKDFTYSYEDTIELNRYFKNTLALINDELSKYKDKLIKEENIKGVYMVFDSYYDYDKQENTGHTVNITNTDEAINIFNSLKNNIYYLNESDKNTEYHTADITFTTDGYTTYSAYINKPYNEIPQEISRYLG